MDQAGVCIPRTILIRCTLDILHPLLITTVIIRLRDTTTRRRLVLAITILETILLRLVDTVVRILFTEASSLRGQKQQTRLRKKDVDRRLGRLESRLLVKNNRRK
jgi:hypothetical protein